MNKLDDQLGLALAERGKAGNRRELLVTQNLVDFVSNDYLGLARNRTLFELIRQREDEIDLLVKNGSGGSRLLSGNHDYYLEVEAFLAKVFRRESALIFNSGYQANLALLSTIPQKGDTILYDQLSHICLKEGAWLSKADSIMFAHNDLEDLERKCRLAKGNIFIAVESIYSMDGDTAPLKEIIALSEKYNGNVIVDEAHSTGSYGPDGSGWLVEEGLHQKVFATVYTFGKAMGIHGACVVGSENLRDYLVNYGRPFIYTTSLPLHSVVAIEQAFSYLSRHQHLQQDLQLVIACFKSNMRNIDANLQLQPLSDTAIQPILVPGNEKAKKVATTLRDRGYDIRPILSPTVKSGTERLRISLHTFNTEKEITALVADIIATIND